MGGSVNIFQKLFGGFSLKGWPFPTRPIPFLGWGDGLPDERNYSRLVGDGGENSIVSACVNYIARTFPEAPPAMWEIDNDGVRNRIQRHPLIRLMRYPTSSPELPRGHYSGILLWMATLTSWVLDGNAYWLKTRSAMGQVVQLWYVPHWMMEPRWPDDNSSYIGWYDYKVSGAIHQIQPRDVVHFRNGFDLNNTRKGISPLHGVLREVFADEEAARFSASVLKNLGVPGLIIAPDPALGGTGWKPSQEDAERMKQEIQARLTGDRRGDALVMSSPTKVIPFGFSPKDLDLSALRDVPEERITAALGLPAAVVGFGAGLQQTKVGATMSELRDQAWQSNLIPTQRLMAEEVSTQLLPDFTSDIDGIEFGFDLSKVSVLQEDRNKLAERMATLTRAGIMKRSEARPLFDLAVAADGSDDLYMGQPGLMAPAADQSAPVNNAPSDTINQLQQQVDDLTNQLADLGKQARADVATKALLDRVPTEIKVTTPPIVFEKGAIQLPAMKQGDVVFQPGSIVNNVDVAPPNLNVQAGAIQANTTIEPGAVTVEQPTPADIQILRDANGRVVGTQRMQGN